MLNLLFQTDSIENISSPSDTSLDIIKSALNRQHKVSICQPNDLSLIDNELCTKSQNITNVTTNNQIVAREPQTIKLKNFDAFFLRQNPPFNLNYVTNTYLLDFIPDNLITINNPKGVRDCPEKIMVMQFPELMPKTIITQNKQIALNFIKQNNKTVIKPLHGNAGHDVFLTSEHDPNLNAILSIFLRQKIAFVLQEFLTEVFKGDRRVILIGGEAVASLNRIPQNNDFRANMGQGAKVKLIPLSKHDHQIAEKLKPTLLKHGLYLAGIDIIGKYLTEINVTSPTGIADIKKLNGPDISSMIVEYLEKQQKTRKNSQQNQQSQINPA